MWFESVFLDVTIKTIVTIAIAVTTHRMSSGFVTGATRKLLRRQDNEPVGDFKKRADTLSNVFSASAKFLIWVVAIATVLIVLGINIASIAAGAGFLGIVVGLGAQATIRDYMSGIFILAENQYRVGDIVTLSGGAAGVGSSGVVEDITLRITKLRDLDGTLNTVRNGEASIITNRTFKYSSVVVDISVTYDTDIDTAERIMNEVGAKMDEDEQYEDEMDEPIHFLRVDSFSESGVVLKAVGKVRPAQQWAVAGEYRRRILKAFAEAGVEVALPRVVIQQLPNKNKK